MNTAVYDKKIILENGQEYYGHSFGADSEKVCELVFNTSMVGYQEILSDPSYTYQAVVMTYPLIGNYGMADDDYETDNPTIGALIVREYNDEPSNFRSAAALSDVMKKYGIPGIYGVDTRKLTRHIRENGSGKVLITDASTVLEEGLSRLRETNLPKDAVSSVSKNSSHTYYPAKTFYSGLRQKPFHIAAIDCGMKQNIIRTLNRYGCIVTVIPWNASGSLIDSLAPDGIFISNGPGDPEDIPETIGTVRALIGKYPMFGICLGHQIISLAYGAKTYKLKFGHRGGNHPVKNLKTGKIEITSQNHSYAVDLESINSTDLSLTHINLLDQTVEGVECIRDRVFSVQYHPESAPGPQDSSYLFDHFISILKEAGNAKKE